MVVVHLTLRCGYQETSLEQMADSYVQAQRVLSNGPADHQMGFVRQE